MSRVVVRRRAAGRRASALLLALVPLALSACGANQRAEARPDSPALQLPAEPTSVAAAPSSTVAVTTAAPTTVAETAAPAPVTTVAPTTLPPTTLPTPIAPPPENKVEDTAVVGTISLPRLGLELPMYEGITLPTLDKGPGHWPGTAMPGQAGNVVVAGHRVSSSRPFRNIDKLVEGDEVVFTVGDASYTYVVTGHEIVTPDAMRIVAQTPARTATLFACHPPGSAEYRWVTHLKLAGT